MENNSYDVYVESALQLAESIVLKSEETAVAVNNLLTLTYGKAIVDPLSPKTWKYYLNVAGQYHITDEVIQVRSLDTLQTIDFTFQNLQIHSATRKAYQYGTTLYKELVASAPDQQRLILGVLYPADLDTAVSAPHGTILAYPPTLVEPSEYTLIQQLQTWIYDFLYRWDNVQYSNSDNLYKVGLYGNLFAFLAVEIQQIRLRMCKTNEVHSYHLRQYLASHGLLDVYLNYLTRRQALFLYRNIAYIERNSGKNAVFKWLVEHIMTERDLPLASYQMRHDVSPMPTQLTPEISFQKVPMNTAINLDMVDVYTPQAVYDKEDPLARDNPVYREEEFDKAIELMTESLDGRLETKLLESTVIDYAGSEHYTLADTLLNHWAWLSHHGEYATYINFNSPLTDELIILPVKDAFVFYFYAMIKIIGFTMTDMPLVMAKRVVRLPKPSLADIRSVATSRVTAAWAQQHLDRQPPLTGMISADGFYSYCHDLHQFSLQQYWMVTQEGEAQTYAEKYAVMSRLWADAWVQLGDTPGQQFANWFAQRNIPISEFTDADLKTVADTILEKSTGVDGINAISLKDIQEAMVRLMTQLSSYSVQYRSTINSGAILDVPNSTQRIDDYQGASVTEDAYDAVDRVLSSDGFQEHQYYLEVGGDGDDWERLVSTSLTIEYPLNVHVSHDDVVAVFVVDMPTNVRAEVDMPVLASNPRRVVPVIGIETYLAQSLAEQANIPDLWVTNP